MHLKDWSVVVSHEPSDAGALATVTIARSRKLLRLAFSDDFDFQAAEDRRHALVHELVHPLVNDLYETVRDGSVGEFGGTALRIFLSNVEREVERAVDALASVIAPSMPLPPQSSTL